MHLNCKVTARFAGPPLGCNRRKSVRACAKAVGILMLAATAADGANAAQRLQDSYPAACGPAVLRAQVLRLLLLCFPTAACACVSNVSM